VLGGLSFALRGGAGLGVLLLIVAAWRGFRLYQWREKMTLAQLEKTKAESEARERRNQEAAREQVRRDILAQSRGPRPSPSLIRTYRDAEEAAAQWMRWLGWGDAAVTPAGRDGGIDVSATHAIAQVKAHVNPIGRPEIQQLFGIAAHTRRTPIFFASAGYTPEARNWADGAMMALFRFDLQGEPLPVNDVARDLWEKGAFPPEASNTGGNL